MELSRCCFFYNDTKYVHEKSLFEVRTWRCLSTYYYKKQNKYTFAEPNLQGKPVPKAK